MILARRMQQSGCKVALDFPSEWIFKGHTSTDTSISFASRSEDDYDVQIIVSWEECLERVEYILVLHSTLLRSPSDLDREQDYYDYEVMLQSAPPSLDLLPGQNSSSILQVIRQTLGKRAQQKSNLKLSHASCACFISHPHEFPTTFLFLQSVHD